MYKTVSSDDIDVKRLREDLMDHFGTATEFFPAATADLTEVQSASVQKLVDIAEKNGFDMRKYMRSGF